MRRGRPENESEERDERKLFCIAMHGKGVKQKESMKEMRMNKEIKLEREEKQPSGIKVSPLLLISMQTEIRLKKMKIIENKQFIDCV